MKQSRFILFFVILTLIQIVLTKFVQLGPFLYFCFIPALILSIPTTRPAWTVMLIAFFCGLAVDILADGPIGLNACAAVLAGAIQRPVIGYMVDNDVVDRHYALSFRRYGTIRILLALLAMTVAYFIMYTVADNAGFRSALFIFTKICLSTLVSLPLGAVVFNTLCPYQR